MEDKRYTVTIGGDEDEELIKKASECEGKFKNFQTVLSFRITEQKYKELKDNLINNPYIYILKVEEFIKTKGSIGFDELKHISLKNRFDAKFNEDILDSVFFKYYFNLEEINDSVKFYKNLYPKIISIDKLPELTHDKRESFLLNINVGISNKKGLYIVGGIHGNEWIPPEALIYFIKKLCSATIEQNDVKIGKKIYPIDMVQNILSGIEFFIFPLANPDGRYKSQSRISIDDVMIGRKNNRPLLENNHGKNNGVDLNRNFSYVWDYKNYSYINNTFPRSSKDPLSHNFIGPNLLSEPETRNIYYVLNKNKTNINYYLDIHSKIMDENLVLYSWGNSKSQSDYSSMNFRNCFYWGQHGSDFYGEYMEKKDLDFKKNIARKMAEAASNSNNKGRVYVARTTDNLYLMSGCSRDFAESLFFVDESFNKIHSFMIEAADDSSYNPSLESRKCMIEEICSSIFELCIEIIKPSNS